MSHLPPSNCQTCSSCDGQQRIIIVSDDRSRQEKRPARYLLLDPAQLLIAP